MKRTSLLLAIILTAVCAWSFGDKDKKPASATIVDAGSFGIFLSGKRIATEKFHIEQTPDVGTITSEIKVDDGNTKAEQTAEMQVAPNGAVRLYRWRSTVPEKEESVIEVKDELLIEHVTPADQKKRDVPYVLPVSTVILDDNFFSHREVLIWRYLNSGCIRVPTQTNANGSTSQDPHLQCGPAHFGILIPRQHMAGNTVVELLGLENVTFKGAERPLNKFKVDTDGVQWFIWVDDDYKVLKMTIPAGNVEVLRD